MSDSKLTIRDLKREVSRFVSERDWAQFHSPKNLSMAIAVEAAELMEHFQWHYDGEDQKRLKKKKVEIEEELSDILAFILSFSAIYNIDLSKALLRKIKLNAKKYPIKKSKGTAKKYTDL